MAYYGDAFYGSPMYADAPVMPMSYGAPQMDMYADPYAQAMSYGGPAYGGGGYGYDMGGGYGGYGGSGGYDYDPYSFGYMDDLSGMGYNGPWPQQYYDYRPPRRGDDSDSDSDDDRRCHRKKKGVTKEDIAGLLDKFESVLHVKHVKKDIEEANDQKDVLKDLAKEKRALKKEVAKIKRDLLLKEALDFNRHSGIAGKRSAGTDRQVVSIEYGKHF